MKLRNSILVKIILLCVGLFLLLGLIYKVGFAEIIKAISGARLGIAALGVFIYLAVIAMRSFKWFLLARSLDGKISYWNFVPLYLTNSLIGNLTPFKSGEIATPFLFKRYLKIPVGQGFSLIIFDRFFELVVFILFLISALFYILNQNIQSNLVIIFVIKIAIIAIFLLLAMLIAVIASRQFAIKITKFLRVFKFIGDNLDGFYYALHLFKNGRTYQSMVVLTIASWLVEILAYYLVFSSVLSAPIISVATAHIIAGAATFITFIPAGIGVSEVGVTSILGFMNYPVSLVAAGAILADIFLTGALLITGFIGSALIRREDVTPY